MVPFPIATEAAIDEQESHAFLPLLEVAATLDIEPTTVRRWFWKGQIVARLRTDGRGYEVDVRTLPPKYQPALLAKLPALESGLRAVVAGEKAERYAVSRETVRERAELRLEAVLSFRKARAQRAPGETFAEVERRWLRNFRRTHPGMKVSVRSVKDWSEAHLDADGIDGLVDGNNGIKQRGARIPAPARQMFKDEYLRAHQPNLRLCYTNVCKVAAEKGWGAMPTYHTFRRYARSLPKLVRKLLREAADQPRTVLPYVRRDPNSIPVYHTIQSDHREIDVPVRCDTGCEVCTGKKPKGHFPIWTAYIDIRSRRILGSDISIDTPNSDFILSVYRRIVDEHGLNQRVYLDNGSNYRKAFGKRLRKQGKSDWNGPSEEQIQARFAPVGVEVVYAIPYNAQAKAIERMFRTFRHRFDEDFEAYRGSLGEKSELARELFKRPSELPTISELAYLLQLAIAEYNSLTPHTGRGMEGRTPDEVFYDEALRIPRRNPDKAFALLFFERVKGGRMVDRNGVSYQNRTYRLASLEKHLEYYGERVDLRINPDDERTAIVLSRTTGEYICEAVVDPHDAGYDTREAITRDLIARVFHDCKELQRMAAAHVAGAKERFAEYRRARIEHVRRLVAEMDAQRQPQVAAAGGAAAVVMIPELSAAARQLELTASAVAAVLDANDAQTAPALCVVSPRRPKRPKTVTGNHRTGDLSYGEIAHRLGMSRKSLLRYRGGKLPWPIGMQDRFEAFERLRASEAPEIELASLLEATPTPPRRERRTGESSYQSMAVQLGVTRQMLVRYRTSKVPWPEGLRERFEALERRLRQTT